MASVDTHHHSPQTEATKDDQHSPQLVLNRYKIEKELGEGSYGKVKLAIDTRTGEKVSGEIVFFG